MGAPNDLSTKRGTCPTELSYGPTKLSFWLFPSTRCVTRWSPTTVREAVDDGALETVVTTANVDGADVAPDGTVRAPDGAMMNSTEVTICLTERTIHSTEEIPQLLGST